MEDAEEITEMLLQAFAEEEVGGFIYGNVSKESFWEQRLTLVRDWIEEGEMYGARLTKVVENDSGGPILSRNIVGFSRWVYPVKLTAEQLKAKQEREDKRDLPPEGTIAELEKEYKRQISAGRKKWTDPEKTYLLHVLGVRPSHQRRGLGTLLIAPGLEAADRAGAQTYIEASTVGFPLYLRLGWEHIDQMALDFSPYGGEKNVGWKYLIREPNAPNKLKTGNTLTT
ncbi:MAG: hypothetical protein Q9163_002975 [Psora crenata]